MTVASRAVVVALGGLLLTATAGCGDDGDDQALQARRAAELAAEFRATATTTTAPLDEGGAPDGADGGAAAGTVAAGPTMPPVEPTGVVVPVIALDNSFRPQLIEVAVGDEVLWENRGLNEHDVLYVEGQDWGVEVDGFQPGDVYAHVFTEPGEYRYFCSIHGTEDIGMIGTVIVIG